MRPLTATFVACILAVLFVSPAQALEVRVQQRDSGRSISLHRGDLLQVSLVENPSTGFSWRTVRRPSRKVLKLTSNRFVSPPQTSPPTVGAPGRRVIVWRAVGSGRTTLKLGLFPPGSNTKAVKSFRLSIAVK